MRTLIFSILGLFLGAVIAWALSVFILHLNWETGLLLIQIFALLGFGIGIYYGIKNSRMKKKVSKM